MENTSTFIQHLKRFLKPLVKLLMNEGFAYQDLDKVLRQVFVEVADEEFKLKEGKKQTTSRIAILTGLNRKEVQRIRKSEGFESENSFSQNRAAAVVSGWSRDTEYPNNSLPLEGEKSFASLVKKYSRDMPVRAVMDELLRVGAVSKVDDNSLKIERDVYIPEFSKLHKFDYISLAAAELIKTGNHNLENNDLHSRMQLVVSSKKLTKESAKEFKEISNKKNMDLLKELDEWLLTNESNKPEKNNSVQAGVSVYYFENEQEDDDNEN